MLTNYYNIISFNRWHLSSVRFDYLVIELKTSLQWRKTERGGSVVSHETLIRKVPGSNPVAGQPS